jgi:hypothetical protein
MTSYCVSITEQTTAKSYLFVKGAMFVEIQQRMTIYFSEFNSTNIATML